MIKPEAPRRAIFFFYIFLWHPTASHSQMTPSPGILLYGSSRSQPTLWGHASRDPRQGLARGQAPFDPHLGGKGASWARGGKSG